MFSCLTGKQNNIQSKTIIMIIIIILFYLFFRTVLYISYLLFQFNME